MENGARAVDLKGGHNDCERREDPEQGVNVETVETVRSATDHLFVGEEYS